MAGGSKSTCTACSDPTFLLADHLGSTSLTTDADGNVTSEMRYNPWGAVRYAWTPDLTPGLPSRYTFTAQYSYMDDPTTSASEGFGLMYYNARWYDVQLGRFSQADSIVPLQSQGVQAWDRYAYVNNNPLLYVDVTGHDAGLPPLFLSGWDPSYGQPQPDGYSCAPTAIAAGISALVGYKVNAVALNQAYIDAGIKVDSYDIKINGNKVGGMLPKMQEMAVNSGSYAIEATASQGTRADLINNLQNGYPTVVTVSWSSWEGYGHALLVVGYDLASDQFSFMDPYQKNDNDRIIITEAFFEKKYQVSFNEAWLIEAKPGIGSGAMLTLRHRPPPKPIIGYGGGGGGIHNNKAAMR